MSLTAFRTLGRSGLVVSPAALGTMTFGNKAWGSPDDVSQAVFNAYMDAGGGAWRARAGGAAAGVLAGRAQHRA